VKNNKIDISLIRKYLQGELDARAMYELERLAQDDPAVMDVILGMEMGNSDLHDANLVTINERVSKRVQGSKIKKMIPWKTWTVAASLVFGVTIATFWMLGKPGNNDLVQNKKSGRPVDSTALAATVESAGQVNPDANAQKISADQVLAANKKMKQKSAFSAPAKPINEDLAVNQPVVVSSSRPFARRSAVVMQPKIDNATVAGAGFGAEQAASDQISKQIINPEARIAASRSKVMLDSGANAIAAVSNKNIMMNDTQTLNEVVVIGYGMQKKLELNAPLAGKVAGIQVKGIPAKSNAIEIKEAHPVNGWKLYKKYLKDNATVPAGKSGKVRLAFTIDEQGKPLAIRIVKSAGEEIDQKAKRLIIEGDKWISGKDELLKEIVLEIRFHP